MTCGSEQRVISYAAQSRQPRRSMTVTKAAVEAHIGQNDHQGAA